MDLRLQPARLSLDEATWLALDGFTALLVLIAIPAWWRLVLSYLLKMKPGSADDDQNEERDDHNGQVAVSAI